MVLAGCQNPNAEGVADFGTIVGRVLNSVNQQPVAVGTVSVGSTIVVNLSTADQGGFVLQRVPVGTQTLVINAPGFNQHREEVAVDKDQTSQAGEAGIVRLDPIYIRAPAATSSPAPANTPTARP